MGFKKTFTFFLILIALGGYYYFFEIKSEGEKEEKGRDAGGREY
jgi:hypothetical protein